MNTTTPAPRTAIRWYGLWWGGTSYSAPEERDLEAFASLAEATEALRDRRYCGGSLRQEFRFLHREPQRVFTPVVSDETEILLYPSSDDLSYPAKRVYIGPRGGARIENC